MANIGLVKVNITKLHLKLLDLLVFDFDQVDEHLTFISAIFESLIQINLLQF